MTEKSYCRDGICPFTDKFPHDCPGETCWLRRAFQEAEEKQLQERMKELERRLKKSTTE